MMMLKKRIIPVVYLKSGKAVQSFGFKDYKIIGSPLVVMQYLEAWGADEIIILDIDATIENKIFDKALLADLAKNISCPLTIGGGIRAVSDVADLLELGADKVSINNMLLETPREVRHLCQTYGSQCIVASIDVVKHHSEYFVYNYKTLDSSLPLNPGLDSILDLGCGELLFNRVDLDGRALGYDLEFFKEIEQKVSVPIIACGGAGDYQDFRALLDNTSFTAAAAGNIFYHSELSYALLKSQLNDACIRKDKIFPVRDRGAYGA